MTTADYWQGLAFDYLTTYSFNREPQLQQLINATEAELRTARFMRQPALQRQLERLRQHGRVPLIDEADAVNPTAVPIARLRRSDAAVAELARILLRPVELDLWSGCAPIYRDALLFLDAQGQRVGVLNICLECAHLQPDHDSFLNRDVRVFEQLRAWLRALGHPVEDTSVDR